MKVEKEQIKQAKYTDLYDFVLRNHATMVNRAGQNYICLVNNRSLQIGKGQNGYYDFATKEGGDSIDFLTNIIGYKFVDAVLALCGEGNAVCETINYAKKNIQKSEEKKHLQLSPHDKKGSEAIREYLSERGIPLELTYELEKRGLVYQTDYMGYKNIIFVNKEKDYAETHGTVVDNGKTFKGCLPGCRDGGFWKISFSENEEKAYVCEAAIDAISLYLLHKKNGEDTNACYISIGGVAKKHAIERIKQEYKKVVLAVDNDEAGQRCRDNNQDCEAIIPIHKDWNEDLCNGGNEHG